MSDYSVALTEAMHMIAREQRSIFVGQAVAYPGTAMTRTFAKVPRDKLLEMPVAEDMQMGIATGLALNGFLPVCTYPRWNFLLLAMSQLVLHLDKLPLFSDYRPRVIIRTAIATPEPMDPGPQHLGDFTSALKLMLKTVTVVTLDRHYRIVPEYRAALERRGSTLLIEKSELYA